MACRDYQWTRRPPRITGLTYAGLPPILGSASECSKYFTRASLNKSGDWVSAVFKHHRYVIPLVESAGYRGRRIRRWRSGPDAGSVDRRGEGQGILLLPLDAP